MSLRVLPCAPHKNSCDNRRDLSTPFDFPRIYGQSTATRYFRNSALIYTLKCNISNAGTHGVRGRISLLRGTRFSLSLSLCFSFPLYQCNLIVEQRAALSPRLQRRARSQRTIKKSTKNKLRSAHIPPPPPFPSLATTRPFLSRSSFSRARLFSLSSACCNLSGVCGRKRALFHPLFPSLFLSFFLRSLSLAPSAVSPPRASLLSFFRGLFGVGRDEAAYERRGNWREISKRGKNRVHAVCMRVGARDVASHLPPFSVLKPTLCTDRAVLTYHLRPRMVPVLWRSPLAKYTHANFRLFVKWKIIRDHVMSEYEHVEPLWMLSSWYTYNFDLYFLLIILLEVFHVSLLLLVAIFFLTLFYLVTRLQTFRNGFFYF